MTLVLGSPGSGKELLFRILGNRLREGKATGKITYNGASPNKKRFHHLTSFIGKNDTGIHIRTCIISLSFILGPVFFLLSLIVMCSTKKKKKKKKKNATSRICTTPIGGHGHAGIEVGPSSRHHCRGRYHPRSVGR